jgi:glycosyltransferase involved in cell wall biosynthesis
MDEQNGTDQPRVSVLIPARNEAPNIAHVLATLPHDVHEVLLVDGGSTDGTIETARAAMPDIRVIKQTGIGKGDALATGLAECTGDIVILLDADGSADGAEIPRFVDALMEGADFAKGSRFLDGGGSSDLTWLRRAGNRAFCRIVNGLYGTRYSDLCYGYNGGWVTALRRLALDCPGFEVETVMNIRSARSQLAVAEVPSFEFPRLHGESNLHPFRDGWRVLKAIVRERRRCADGPVELAPPATPVLPATIPSLITPDAMAVSEALEP